ncbi:MULTISPECIES: hypothetical protein [unclassified Streptomyces]|uniref:hypothetical protein n=1 Tax=unclassified Streptomyces TaxID=2593676 RepID=UPI0035DE5925
MPTATERTGQRRLPAERIRDDNLLNVGPKDQAVLHCGVTSLGSDASSQETCR